MPLDPEFVKESFYEPEGLMIDEVLEVDREQSLVRVRMPTHDDLPLTRLQKVHPTRHPRHVSGGLIIHMTGVAGMVHAYYVFDLRHSDGWVGYGGAIHKGRYKNLAPPGEPIVITCRATRVRRREKSIMARYDLRFVQGDQVIYEGDQTAMWMKIEGDE
jgi:3-hydroxymyristoyl/3-hydroxydecanoyl-(acyl carrier protein) dehydratase